ncbi:MAG: HDIG domain-containing protein [Trueperaceae bacterium]|nr:HDIG domain-containing protein [Trueperaceae bacterium]
MTPTAPMRDRAYALMTEWTRNDGLRRHMLAVEAAVDAYALEEGADRDLWAATALLHDFDYEAYPDPSEEGHPFVGVRHLRAEGWPEEVCEAILGHADYTGVSRASRLAKVLYACDEVTGLITAAVLVRPDKDVREQTPKSLKKKFKDKAFARGVNRDDVRRGAEELGVDLWTHVTFVLSAMQGRAEALGLDGSQA